MNKLKKISWSFLASAICWLAVFVYSLNTKDDTFISGVLTMIFLCTSITNIITFIIVRISTNKKENIMKG